MQQVFTNKLVSQQFSSNCTTLLVTKSSGLHTFPRVGALRKIEITLGVPL